MCHKNISLCRHFARSFPLPFVILANKVTLTPTGEKERNLPKEAVTKGQSQDFNQGLSDP